VQVVVVPQETIVAQERQAALAVEVLALLIQNQEAELLELPTLEAAQERQVIPMSTASTAVQALSSSVMQAHSVALAEQLHQLAVTPFTPLHLLVHIRLNRKKHGTFCKSK
jgi:hypothetical protein